MIKKYHSLIVFLFFVGTLTVTAQKTEPQRIKQLEKTLDSLQISIVGLKRTVTFNVSNIELPSFIRAVGASTKVNISVSPQLKSIVLTHNFSNATVKNILLYLCKEHQLTFDITGNIFSLKKLSDKKIITPKIEREIPVTYNKKSNLFSIDLQNDNLSVAFKKITDVTGKNLVFSPDLGTKKLSGYIKNKPFESALDKLAFANNLLVTKTKDGYYLFESTISKSNNKKGKQRPKRYRNSNFYYKIVDTLQQKLNVDFENTSITSIIKDIGFDLNINMFTNVPIDSIGTASVKATNISYDKLLTKILEDTKFTFKKKNNIYYFGKKEQATLRNTVSIPLMHRSIEIMNQPMNGRNNFNNGFNNENTINTNNQNFNTNNRQNNLYDNNINYGQNLQINTRNNRSFGNYESKSEALINILPKEVVKDLEITTDIEHNAFIVSGDAQNIEKFKRFIARIDKPVPVILIEVMILDVSKSRSVDTGVEFGLAENSVKDKGTLFSGTDVTLGATTINKIIGGFNGFGSLNIGKVVPNFYAKIKAMETNGNVKIRSTPKLSTLNGHNAFFSSGERSYYAITRRDIIGSQNPQTTEIKNYVPINADLSISIKPLVSGDDQITLSINVVQSSFNGKRIDNDAPPGMNSREFTSTIRVRDQDVIILGGLEENVNNDATSGVPFLARVPIIKWLFSKKTRTKSKSKLSVLIKPTIIR